MTIRILLPPEMLLLLGIICMMGYTSGLKRASLVVFALTMAAWFMATVWVDGVPLWKVVFPD